MRNALKRHRVLLVSGALGVSAALFSGITVSTYVTTLPVVVAARDLIPYERIGRSDVKVVEMPARAVHPASLALDKVIGGFASGYIVAGQQILEGHLWRGPEAAGISFDLPAGWRAMFVPVTLQKCLGGEIRPGERVDVIFCPKDGYPGSGQGAITVLRNVIVLGVKEAVGGSEFGGIIVRLSPEACEILAMCLERGSVYLSLVPRIEASKAEEDGTHP